MRAIACRDTAGRHHFIGATLARYFLQRGLELRLTGGADRHGAGYKALRVDGDERAVAVARTVPQRLACLLDITLDVPPHSVPHSIAVDAGRIRRSGIGSDLATVKQAAIKRQSAVRDFAGDVAGRQRHGDQDDEPLHQMPPSFGFSQ